VNEKKYEVLAKEPLYEGYFRADRWRVRHTTFRGGWSDVHGLEIFDRGHAASVLPWDPVTDEVILVEQFRAAAIPTAESPWLLEAIAGAMKPGEKPEEVARREAMEEAGLRLTELRHVTSFLPSCGAVTEELHVYVAPVDAASAGGVHGLQDEHEDMKVHVLPFTQVLAMTEAGRIVAGNTIVAVYWLALHREELRAAWSALR
jgi:ADP-ribose pyrophosphatase